MVRISNKRGEGGRRVKESVTFRNFVLETSQHFNFGLLNLLQQNLTVDSLIFRESRLDLSNFSSDRFGRVDSSKLFLNRSEAISHPSDRICQGILKNFRSSSRDWGSLQFLAIWERRCWTNLLRAARTLVIVSFLKDSFSAMSSATRAFKVKFSVS